MFPNFWQGECSGGARRRAWKRSGLRQTLNATVSKVDNLVWLPSARKRENWSRGPTVDDFCAGTHGCPPKIGDPRLTHRGPRVDLRPRLTPAHVHALEYSALGVCLCAEMVSRWSAHQGRRHSLSIAPCLRVTERVRALSAVCPLSSPLCRAPSLNPVQPSAIHGLMLEKIEILNNMYPPRSANCGPRRKLMS